MTYIGLYDEQDLKQACSFSLITAQTEFVFFSHTSTSYQQWVGALTQAFESMSLNSNVQYRPTSPTTSIARPNSPSNSAVGSGITRPISVMSRDPEDYVETHRVISVNRNTSRRSISQNRRKSYAQDALLNLNQAKCDSVSPGDDFGKKSFFQILKSFFAPEPEMETNAFEEPEAVLEGGRRTRSKSIVKYLFGNTEND